MGELFVVDWSFILILVLLGCLTLGLAIRRLRIKRRAKREERRAARREYQRWLRNSSAAPLETTDHDNAVR